VEHYEIAAYGSARPVAEVCGHQQVAQLLDETLDEEKLPLKAAQRAAISVAGTRRSFCMRLDHWRLC
jgi:ferritin-like metal-binding protein YciE